MITSAAAAPMRRTIAIIILALFMPWEIRFGSSSGAGVSSTAGVSTITSSTIGVGVGVVGRSRNWMGTMGACMTTGPSGIATPGFCSVVTNTLEKGRFTLNNFFPKSNGPIFIIFPPSVGLPHII